MRTTRFHYNGSWTRWFADDEDITPLRTLDIDAVEVSEEMSREEFKRRYPDHQANDIPSPDSLPSNME